MVIQEGWKCPILPSRPSRRWLRLWPPQPPHCSGPRRRRTSTLVTYLEDLAGRKLAADEIAVASEAYRDALRGSGDQ